jgi:SAM-dependent methyltransferase
MEQTGVFNQQYSEYYNLFYSEKNYAAEVDYVDRVIRSYHHDAKRILEYGSGTGGHGLLIGKKGYDIAGIERSDEMAKIARAKGFKCEVGDITSYTIDEKFDICLALFHVVSYINTNELLIQLFQNTRKHLNKEGLFIFDVWFSPAVIYQMPEVRVKKVDNQAIEVTRIASPVLDHSKNIVDVNYHIIIRDKKTNVYNEFKETHSMRHFAVPEIDLIARQTGFKLLQAEEFLTGKEPSIHTWGVNFILQVNE